MPGTTKRIGVLTGGGGFPRLEHLLPPGGKNPHYQHGRHGVGDAGGLRGVPAPACLPGRGVPGRGRPARDRLPSRHGTGLRAADLDPRPRRLRARAPPPSPLGEARLRTYPSPPRGSSASPRSRSSTNRRSLTVPMPSHKYRPYETVDLPDRTWPNVVLDHAPIWCSTHLRWMPGSRSSWQPIAVAPMW